MERNEFREYYIPKGLESSHRRLVEYYGPHLREFKPSDEGANRVPAMIIESKGGKNRESFRGFSIVCCDVGKIGSRYGEIFVVYPIAMLNELDGAQPKHGPVKFDIHAHKVLIFG